MLFAVGSPRFGKRRVAVLFVLSPLPLMKTARIRVLAGLWIQRSTTAPENASALKPLTELL